MLYQRTLVIPASTPITDPVSETLKLAIGVSTRREIFFPEGCCGLAHVRVFHGGWQIVPWTRDEWIASSGETVIDESPYPITTAPTTFTLYGYNEDPDNDHTIQLRVQLREGEVEEFLRLGQFLDALRGK